MSTTPKNHGKTISIIMLFIAILLMTVIYFGIIKPKQTMNTVNVEGVYLKTPQLIKDFHLTDNNGKDFTQANLKGRWTLLFFGFTNCGMVCPTTMAAFNGMYKTLKTELPENQLPQVVMVSVDPMRDTQKRMNEYVTSFNTEFKGLRGTDAETASITGQLHIAAAKLVVDGQPKDQYSINHTAEILVVNPKGELQALLSYPHTAEQLVKDYKLLLNAV